MKKLAQFCLLSGLLLVVIFVVSPSLGFDHYYFCVGGLGCIIFSFLLQRLGGSRSSQSKRFQTLRKVLGKDEKKGGEE
ncbi:MAG: hypothetical protein R6U57_03455 [Anaerolineales bacterium]